MTGPLGIWALALLPALGGAALWGLRPSALGAVAAAVAAATAGLALVAGGAEARLAWSGTLHLSAALPPLAQLMAVTVPLIALPILLFAAAHEDRQGLPRLVGLLLIFTGGMELIAISADLLTLLIGWELVGACSWALIGHRWREEAPGRSAIYAFVMTRAGDLGLFLALFATFRAAGDLSYAALGGLSGPALGLPAAGILVAAASKSGQVPFAPWLFRAMDGPVSVSALLHSATMVAAGVLLLARLQPALSAAPLFGPAAIGIGLLTALAGGVVALRQVHAKKVLAGSTSAQMGLMIAAVGAGYPGVAMLHLVVHAATKAALFLSAGVAHDAAGSYDLRQMRLGRALGGVALFAAIAALSLAAVPPLAGGWSKERLVAALEHAGPLAAAAGVLAGVLSAAYAARFAWMAWGPGGRRGAAARGAEQVALALLALGILALSALWLPAIGEAVAARLGVTLPHSSPAWTAASLLGVAAGIVAGLVLSRRTAAAPRSDWLGLPGLIDRGITRPALAAARGAARVDDRWLDLIPRGAAALGLRVSALFDRLDGRNPLPRGATALGLRVSALFDRLDGRDPLPRGAAGLGLGLSRGAARSVLPELVPRLPALLAGRAGTRLRRLQSGLVHQYYVILVAGAALGMLLLIFGA